MTPLLPRLVLLPGLLAPGLPAALIQPPAQSDGGAAPRALDRAEDPGPAVLHLAGTPVPRDEYGTWLVRHRGPLMVDLFARSRAVARAAAARGIEVDPAEVERLVAREFQQRVRHAFGGDRDAWLEEVEALGRTETGLRLERTIDARTEFLAEELMQGDREIPPGVVEAEWESQYGPGGREPRLSLILAGLPELSRRQRPSPEERERAEAEALARAEAAYSRLVAGAPFDRVAREVSDDDASRLAGGAAPDDFSISGWPAESIAAVEALEPGALTRPVRGLRGFWIVRLEGIVETPLAEVREELERELLERPPGAEEQRLFLESVVGRSDPEVLPGMHRPAPWRVVLPGDEPVVAIGEERIPRNELAAWLRRYRGEDLTERFALWWRIEELAHEADLEIAPEEVAERARLDRERVIEQTFGGDEEKWLADLERRGRNLAVYEEEVLLRTRSTLIAEALLIAQREITDEQVRREWEERYGPGGTALRARMMVLRPPAPEIGEGTTAEQLAERVEAAFQETLARARDLRERVLVGEDFATLARRHSEDPVTAQRGGRLEERFRPHQWPPEVAEAVTALTPGGVTEPLRLSDSVLLFELDERTHTDFEDVRDDLREELRTARPTEPELAAFRNLTQQSVPVDVLPAMYH